jgi:hypothetical protein
VCLLLLLLLLRQLFLLAVALMVRVTTPCSSMLHRIQLLRATCNCCCRRRC